MSFISLVGLIVAVLSPAAALGAGAGTATPKRPLVASHRGSTEAEPENTLPAMAWAKALGADVVEVDLRATADRQIVVIHDKRLDRTTNGSGLVRQHTLAEISVLDAGRGYRVPTVEDALAFAVAHGVHLLFDIKDAHLDVAALLQSVRKHGAEDQVVFGVRTLGQLASLRRAGAGVRTLAFTPSPTVIHRYLERGVDAVRLWPAWIRSQPELIRTVQQAGVQVWITTGQLEGDALRAIIEMGVDGLITDRPQAAIAEVRSR